MNDSHSDNLQFYISNLRLVLRENVTRMDKERNGSLQDEA